MKKFISIVLVVIIALSCITATASAATIASVNKNNCKWNQNYLYVNTKGGAYGTNTFYIYGDLCKDKAKIQNASPSAAIKINDCQKKAVYDVARFSVKIYKGSKLINSYTVKLGGTFTVPAGLGTKYTVKITYIPPATQTALYKAACGANASWYYMYRLVDVG